VKECYNQLSQHCNGQYDFSKRNNVLTNELTKFFVLQNFIHAKIAIMEFKTVMIAQMKKIVFCKPDRGTLLCNNQRSIQSIWTCNRGNNYVDYSNENDCLKNSVTTVALRVSLICDLFCNHQYDCNQLYM